LLQVFEHGGGLQQAAVVEDDGVFKQGAQAFVALLFLLTLRCEWLQRHPGAQGQTAQRLPEVYVLLFHHEFENVSPFVTLTEAAPGACFRPDDESRRAGVRVERAKANIGFARFPQLHAALGDNIHDRQSFFDLFYRRHIMYYRRA
jgi:hypothetical protein